MNGHLGIFSYTHEQDSEVRPAQVQSQELAHLPQYFKG